MNPLLKSAYLATRRRLESKGVDSRASRAIELARANIERGQLSFYFESGLGSYQNQPSEDGGRWIEAPELAGLRFVGFADEVARRAGSRSVDNYGWFMYPDGDPAEVARGAVYQLPATPDGRPRYVPAIREGETLSNWRDWRNISRDGAAVLYLGDIFEGDPGGTEDGAEQAALDAARFADGRAERRAEAERDYHEAWNAGRLLADTREEVTAERSAFLKLAAELRAVRRSGVELAGDSAICAELRGALRGHARSWRAAKKRAAALWNDRPCNGWQFASGIAAAYAEGAGLETESL